MHTIILPARPLSTQLPMIAAPFLDALAAGPLRQMRILAAPQP